MGWQASQIAAAHPAAELWGSQINKKLNCSAAPDCRLLDIHQSHCESEYITDYNSQVDGKRLRKLLWAELKDAEYGIEGST